MTRALNGFVVGETEKAFAFVLDTDAKLQGVKPLWLPKGKVVNATEGDAMSRCVNTAHGDRQGVPYIMTVDTEFLERVGL